MLTSVLHFHERFTRSQWAYLFYFKSLSWFRKKSKYSTYRIKISEKNTWIKSPIPATKYHPANNTNVFYDQIFFVFSDGPRFSRQVANSRRHRRPAWKSIFLALTPTFFSAGRAVPRVRALTPGSHAAEFYIAVSRASDAENPREVIEIPPLALSRSFRFSAACRVCAAIWFLVEKCNAFLFIFYRNVT